MKFSKETIKRGMAGGLIALMIASNVACDKKESSVNDWLEAQKIGDVNVMDITGYEDAAIPSEWRASKWSSDGAINLQAVPISFFRELGIVENRDDGAYLKDNYILVFRGSYAYANPDKNEIHLIVRLAVGNYHTRQYHLQYKVSDEELQTFANLDGDFRMRFFIQGLDATHKRSIVNELDFASAYDSIVRSGGLVGYVDNFDIKNGTVSYVYEKRSDKNKLWKSTHSLSDATIVEGNFGSYLGFSGMTWEGDPEEVIASADENSFISVDLYGDSINEEYKK